MLAVLDTNVLVSGLCRHAGSATYEIIEGMGVRWDLAATPQIFFEYEDVLMRPAIRRLTGLSPREVAVVLDYIAELAWQTTISYYWRPNLQDEADNKFVECAVAARADCLVTGNIKDYLRAEMGPFEFDLIRPREFLNRLSKGEY